MKHTIIRIVDTSKGGDTLASSLNQTSHVGVSRLAFSDAERHRHWPASDNMADGGSLSSQTRRIFAANIDFLEIFLKLAVFVTPFIVVGGNHCAVVAGIHLPVSQRKWAFLRGSSSGPRRSPSSAVTTATVVTRRRQTPAMWKAAEALGCVIRVLFLRVVLLESRSVLR